nr:immunoglobulin heavy chain junction region [Mus musculus]
TYFCARRDYGSSYGYWYF